MGRETDLLQMWRARKLQRTPESKGAERHEEMDPWQLEAYEYLLQQELAEAEEAHDEFVRFSEQEPSAFRSALLTCAFLSSQVGLSHVPGAAPRTKTSVHAELRASGAELTNKYEICEAY